MTSITDLKIRFKPRFGGKLDGPAQRLERADERPLCAFVSALSCHDTWTGDDGDADDAAQRAIDRLKLPLSAYTLTEWATACDPAMPRGCFFHHEVVEFDSFKLEAYQRDAIAHLTRAGGVLALGCGLGKTYTAITAVCSFAAGRGEKASRLVIVCPLNAKGVWEDHRKFVEPYFEEIIIISQDSLHKLDGLDYNGSAIIFDEAHFLGDWNAKRTKEAHALRAKHVFGLCLTGTLLHGGVEKILSIRDLAVPGLGGFVNRWEMGRFFNCIVEKTIPGVGTKKVLEIPGSKEFDKFCKYMSHGVVSLSTDSPTVRECLELPEQTVDRVRLGEPWPTFKALVIAELARAELDGEPMPNMAALAHRLARAGLPAKINWLTKNYASAADGPLVLFAAYTDTIRALEAWCEARGWKSVTVNGEVIDDARTEAVRKFQAGEAQVFIGQMVAAGVAVSLTRAHVSVAVDHVRSAAAYSQALARTCRRGQTVTCNHYDLVANEFQDAIVSRLESHADFDASTTEWQDAKRLLEDFA